MWLIVPHFSPMYKGEASNGYIDKRTRGDKDYIYFQYYDLKTGKRISVYCGIGIKGILEAKTKRAKYLEENQRLLSDEIIERKKRNDQEIFQLKEEIAALKQEIDIAEKIHRLDTKKPTGTLDDYISS